MSSFAPISPGTASLEGGSIQKNHNGRDTGAASGHKRRNNNNNNNNNNTASSSGGATGKGSSGTPPGELSPLIYRNVYISGLPTGFTSNTFRQLCQQFGQVEASKLCVDANSSPTKGYGFCLFMDAESAAACIKGLQGAVFGGRKLQARYADAAATPQPVHSPGNGAAGGGGGRRNNNNNNNNNNRRGGGNNNNNNGNNGSVGVHTGGIAAATAAAAAAAAAGAFIPAAAPLPGFIAYPHPGQQQQQQMLKQVELLSSAGTSPQSMPLVPLSISSSSLQPGSIPVGAAAAAHHNGNSILVPYYTTLSPPPPPSLQSGTIIGLSSPATDALSQQSRSLPAADDGSGNGAAAAAACYPAFFPLPMPMGNFNPPAAAPASGHDPLSHNNNNNESSGVFRNGGAALASPQSAASLTSPLSHAPSSAASSSGGGKRQQQLAPGPVIEGEEESDLDEAPDASAAAGAKASPTDDAFERAPGGYSSSASSVRSEVLPTRGGSRQHHRSAEGTTGEDSGMLSTASLFSSNAAFNNALAPTPKFADDGAAATIITNNNSNSNSTAAMTATAATATAPYPFMAVPAYPSAANAGNGVFMAAPQPFPQQQQQQQQQQYAIVPMSGGGSMMVLIPNNANGAAMYLPQQTQQQQAQGQQQQQQQAQQAVFYNAMMIPQQQQQQQEAAMAFMPVHGMN